MPTATPGLRDRKREETRARLEKAAVTLVLRDGLDHATVDSISSMAEVSPRTFFNYFETKEDAILGIRDIDLGPEVVAEHLARLDGADAVESTVALVVGIISPSIEGASLHDSRHEVLRQHPQLFGRHVALMTRMIDQLTNAVTAILEHDGQGAVEPGTADVFLSLCAGAVRSTVKTWIDEGAAEPAESIEPRATHLVRTLLERLS